MGPVLGVVGGAGDLAAGAGPVGVDEFASWLVDALVGVCAEVVALGLEQVGGETLGIPTPTFSNALSFYDSYRSARLPANLLQAQRDYFGAHTYERTDKPRKQFFHTNWTGQGGTTHSTSYNA